MNSAPVVDAPVADSPAPSPSAVTLTFFRPGEKAHGFRQPTSWEHLYTRMANVGPAKTTNKLALPGWSPATFVGNHRQLAKVEHVAALVLDFDNTSKPDGAKKTEPLAVEKRIAPEAAMALWTGTTAFFYTSWSHTRELPRFRLVIPLSRPVTAAEFTTLWTYAANRHIEAGHVVDEQCKDASHLWFFGSRRNDDYATGFQAGEPLDVDSILVAASIADDVNVEGDAGDDSEPEGHGPVTV